MGFLKDYFKKVVDASAKTVWEGLWDFVKAHSVGLIAAIGIGGTGTGAIVFWEKLSSLLAQEIKLSMWCFILLLAASIILLFVVALIVWRHFKATPIKWLSYTSDEFEDLKWQWKYRSTNNEIFNLIALCPKHNLQLKPYDSWSEEYGRVQAHYPCDLCKKDLVIFNDAEHTIENRIIRLIHMNIRNEKYPK